MILLLDVGNSRIKAASCTGSARRLEALAAVEHAGLSVEQWLSDVTNVAEVDRVYYASVAAPEVAEAIERWAAAQSISTTRARTTANELGVRCAYADPSRLGVDRWLVVLAAAASEKDCLIVNAGTACTIDVVTPAGEHRGGLILPGIGLARSALNQRTQFFAEAQELVTAGLPVLGNDTDPAVNLGCLHAVAGAIQRVERQLGWQKGHGHKLLAGGEAPLLHPLLGKSWQLRPHLVMEGLARLALSEKNR